MTENAIDALFRIALQHHPDKSFLQSAAGDCSYAGFYERCRVLGRHLRHLPEQRLACHAADSPARVALLLASALGDKSLLLFNQDDSAAQVREQSRALGIELLITDIAQLEREAGAAAEATGQAETEAELFILSSGTSGAPKCARYCWRDLVAQIPRRRIGSAETWLLAYRLNHFAGIQVLLHILLHGQTLVIPDSDRVGAALRAIRQFGVSHISSTPTFWRFALAALPPGPLPLRHITLGSETVTAELLQALRQRFPEARLVHVYATTELGSLVSVNDGKPGLPRSVLSRDSSAPVRFRIVEGELQVKSQHGMRAYLPAAGAAPAVRADGWQGTGDLVRIEGDRILFQGRRSEIINVGGVKVHPQEVEAVVNAVSGVKLVRAYGQDNPLSGQIVALNVVLRDGVSEPAVEDSIYAACRQLPPHCRPRNLNFVDSLNLNNFKLERR